MRKDLKIFCLKRRKLKTVVRKRSFEFVRTASFLSKFSKNHGLPDRVEIIPTNIK